MATNAAAPPRQLSQKEADIQMMLAAEVHLGTKNCDFQMERYVFKRRNDGIYISLSSDLVIFLVFVYAFVFVWMLRNCIWYKSERSDVLLLL